MTYLSSLRQLEGGPGGPPPAWRTVLEVTIALVIVATHARLAEYYSEVEAHKIRSVLANILASVPSEQSSELMPYAFGLAHREHEAGLPDQLYNLESDVGQRQDRKDPTSETETERVFYNFKTKTDDDDVVDREDHVTQYLSELLVNTDSEITSLQVNEYDES
ncbi:hypothetical protein MSG28_015751 [Choristoneura fumiferana]|uniref:Uncharacterized protein n=1 Tax=Choristoneura fumiferana TaxID=7141 RepID=A0ACC0KC45_CHOFU|nr:hypothetical protein MSG28_015751 [Choristoneura fumiferana]